MSTHSAKPTPTTKEVDPDKLTIGQIVGALRPGHLWTLGGLFVVLLSSVFTLGVKSSALLGDKPKATQHWLTVHSVLGQDNNFVRVTARVNGIMYAYPADVAYTQLGQNMATQDLPLPIAESYTVSFDAELNEPDSQYRSRATDQFQASALPPNVHEHKVFLVRANLKLSEFLTVRYAVR